MPVTIPWSKDRERESDVHFNWFHSQLLRVFVYYVLHELRLKEREGNKIKGGPRERKRETVAGWDDVSVCTCRREKEVEVASFCLHQTHTHTQQMKRRTNERTNERLLNAVINQSSHFSAASYIDLRGRMQYNSKFASFLSLLVKR